MKKEIYIPIYNEILVVRIVSDKKFKKLFEKYNFIGVYKEIGALTFTHKNKFHIVFRKKSIDISFIVHEAKHAVNRIFYATGVELDIKNDEAECFLLDFIVRKIYNLYKKELNPSLNK